jgi:hypothetical protein
MNALVLNNNEICINVPTNYDIINVLAAINTYQHIIWIFEEGSDDASNIQEFLEECCLLKTLTIYGDCTCIKSWIDETFDNIDLILYDVERNELVPIIDISNNQVTYINPPINPVISTLTFYNPSSSLLTQLPIMKNKMINFTLSLSDPTWKTIHVDYIRQVKTVCDDNNIIVKCINGITFDRNENIFNQTQYFIDYMKKNIEFAKLLGANFMIYGQSSTISNNVSPSQLLYDQYFAHFVKVFSHLASIAKVNSVVIIMKPNGIFSDLQIVDLVKAIGSIYVKAGKSRTDIITDYDEFGFQLIEFPGTFVQSLHL